MWALPPVTPHVPAFAYPCKYYDCPLHLGYLSDSEHGEQGYNYMYYTIDLSHIKEHSWRVIWSLTAIDSHQVASIS